MKNARTLFALALILASTPAFASVSSDMSQLGSNSEINERANRLESRTRMAIVQNRAVDLHNRLELGVNYQPVAAGDSYLRTQNVGAQIDFHFSPRISLGVRYEKSYNGLTDEGKQQYEAAAAAQASGGIDRPTVPSIVYPDESLMGVLNVSMIYGKLNWFDLKTVQFDIYGLGGAGTQKLVNAADGKVTSSPTYTAGGGLGLWLSNHITSRLELRWQGYQEKNDVNSRDMNLIIANLGFGVLL